MAGRFDGLTYTLANEDPLFEQAVLDPGLDHVVGIAGSGSRLLPLLTRRPRRMTCVDVSQAQLHLTSLRIESVRSLGWEEYLAFWGYPPRASAGGQERRELFSRIEGLGAEARGYFAALFEARRWSTILYQGQLERRAGKLSRLLR